MARHEDSQGLLGRLDNVRDAMEEALGHARGIENDYRRGLLEAHLRGALREVNEQMAELGVAAFERVEKWQLTISHAMIARLRPIGKEDGQVEHRHGTTLERLREHLTRADGELEAAQRFLDPGTWDEDEAALVSAIADARTLVGDALETTRWRLEGSDRG